MMNRTGPATSRTDFVTRCQADLWVPSRSSHHRRHCAWWSQHL